MKSKTNTILWCFFLGAFGAHKFYIGQTGWGVLYKYIDYSLFKRKALQIALG